MKKSPFVAVVEQALKRYQDPAWLGKHSPLASPYFLGTQLSANAVTSLARGHVLQRLLHTCCEQITGRYQERYQGILQHYYFQEHTVDVAADAVGLGRNSFHLSRNEAIGALAEIMIAQSNPALRLETPPKIGQLFDYDEQATQCVQLLRNNATISILGSGGVGKTTISAAIANQMTTPVFWYTIYPGLTDYLEAFLFAFGYFLYVHGSPALWLELVATDKQAKLERLLSVARYALAQLTPDLPLICLDEIDLLDPSVDARHVPLVRFIENLRGLSPLLLIGQRPLLDTDHYYTLSGLSPRSARRLLTAAGITFSPEQLTRLMAITHGNPRLLELYMALYNTHDSLDTLLEDTAAQPPLELLLTRILQRLNDPERSLMMELSVFRRPAPVDVWGDAVAQRALEKLSTYRLVQHDHLEGIALLPAYRQTLYNLLPSDRRQELHAGAAITRAKYGDFAGAVFHMIGANQIEEAIWFCYEQRQSIINQGQAQAVLATLQRIDTQSLTPVARETSALLCAELTRLAGNTAKALEDIHAILWRTPILALDAHRLAGVIANDESDFGSAEESFHRALGFAETIVEARLSDIHRGLAWRHLRERAMDRALREAQLAGYEIAQLQGELQRELGHYDSAQQYYEGALTIAEELNHIEGVAKTSTTLALAFIAKGAVDESKQYLERATASYERLGKVIPLASLGINWALVHNMAGDGEAAIVAAHGAQQRLAAFGEVPPRQQGLIDLALAEAHLGLEQLDEAARFAQNVLELEDIDLMPDAYRILGEILTQQGEGKEAVRFIRMSIDLATEYEDSHIAGYGWRALGQTLCLNGESAAAREAFATAATLFQQMNLTNELVKTEHLMESC